jgi:predicted esterase
MSSSFEQRTTQYHLQVPSRYLHAQEGEGKPLLLMVHGFADSAASFVRRALPASAGRFELLAPNGPFPLPQRVENEWKEAYGWYFADFSAKKIHVHPEVAARAVASLVQELGLSARPKVLCGFSQGGYFLPHLAHELKEVKQMITIGAGFHPEFFASYGLRLPVTAIHGTEDEIIPMAGAKEEFSRLGSWNTGGSFVEISGMTHAINAEGKEALGRVISSLQID